jgi:hypothetical protein
MSEMLAYTSLAQARRLGFVCIILQLSTQIFVRNFVYILVRHSSCTGITFLRANSMTSFLDRPVAAEISQIA